VAISRLASARLRIIPLPGRNQSQPHKAAAETAEIATAILTAGFIKNDLYAPRPPTARD
jgi:hypothetical protein